MTNIIIIALIGFLTAFFLWNAQTKKSVSSHETKPLIAAEKALSDDFINGLINSDYAKSLDSLKNHVTGHTVIGSATGNAGFILNLDNDSWASAFRVDNKISAEYGSGIIPQEALNKINSVKFGDASNKSIDDRPYSNEENNITEEVNKSHGKLIEGLAIGDNTFNFAFEDEMELDFQLCNDESNKPSIRVFWEQW